MLLLPNIYAFYYYKPTITRLFAVRIICVERERERERERELSNSSSFSCISV